MQLDKQGNYATRQLPDGRMLYVFPLTYGRARLGIGSTYDSLIFDNEY